MYFTIHPCIYCCCYKPKSVNVLLAPSCFTDTEASTIYYTYYTRKYTYMHLFINVFTKVIIFNS